MYLGDRQGHDLTLNIMRKRSPERGRPNEKGNIVKSQQLINLTNEYTDVLSSIIILTIFCKLK